VSVTVRVPASSANLGPGFDALALALGLHDRVEVAVTAAGLDIEVAGEGAGSVPCDESHLVVMALRATLDALGEPQPAGLALRCHNVIPHARGLGSSAAALVAGVGAGYGLAGVELDAAERAGRALQVAASFEGHADNAAASLLGGLVVAWQCGNEFHATRLSPHPSLSPVVLLPESTSATATTRGLLPQRVPLRDAAFNAGRAALAVHALTARPDLLLAATEDRLHQQYRRPAYPATTALVETLRESGIAAAVSGAGPAVLAFITGTASRTAPAAALPIEPLPLDPVGFEIRPMPVELAGVQVRNTGVG
jgi:homoserine kinase